MSPPQTRADEVYFHAWLHRETHRHFYNTGYVSTVHPLIQNSTELQTHYAMQEMDTVCPYKELKPLSLNYSPPSMQRSLYVVSGASIPGNKRLFRVTLRTRKRIDPSNTIYNPLLLGPLSNPETQFEDFRLLGGQILRVPGQLRWTSSFTDFGWWVEASA
jgi:hypothetical protein